MMVSTPLPKLHGPSKIINSSAFNHHRSLYLSVITSLLCFSPPASSWLQNTHTFSTKAVVTALPNHNQCTVSSSATRKSQSRSSSSSSRSRRSMTSLSSLTVWQKGNMSKVERRCLLPVSAESHKGSSGRIGVLGGSAQYTGAPYYAGMASLQTGADLAYILTAEEAALPIKCYSPELMVTPVYSATKFDAALATADAATSEESERLVQEMVEKVTPFLDRFHSLIVGPGLGRCPLVLRAVSIILQRARERNLQLVLDADALFLVSLPEYRSVLEGYEKVVLTPNGVEFKRLLRDDSTMDTIYPNATIIKKGHVDSIQHNGVEVYRCEELGGLKRSGGIGDVLAGAVGTLTAWNVILQQQGQTGKANESPDLSLSCWTACCFVKHATMRAFAAKRRSMTAPDVLAELGRAINEMTYM